MKDLKHKLITSLFMCALAGMVLAATTTPSWKNATKNTDDTNIAATGPGSLKSTSFEWSLCGAGDTFTTRLGIVTNSTQLVPGANASGPSTPDLPPGRYCGRVFHTNTYDVNSDFSDVVVKVIDAPKPGKPTNPSWP